MPQIEAIEAGLMAPGALFETVEDEVLGARMRVFRRRAPSLRALLEASHAFGEREYLVFEDRRLRFDEHLRAVASVARAFSERFGIGPGDRVAILGSNRAEWIVAFWATVSLGAVAVAMNAWWTRDELLYALADCEPKLLLADAKRLDRLGSTEPGLAVLELERDVRALERDDPGAALPTVPIAEDDPACLLYTSGTSGRPKGAVHSHRNVIALVGLQFFHGMRVAALSPPLPDAPPPCQLVQAPLFHVSGLHTGAIAMLAGGVRTVWTTGRFDPLRVLELIESEKVTGWSPMGPMAHRVAHHPEVGRFDLSSVRAVGSGGAPMPPELQRRLREVFPNARHALAVGYGLTECTGLATIEFGQGLERRPHSVGRPLPTVQVEIRDEEGRPLPEGEEGEVCVRSPLVMLGYWRRPQATREAIGPDRWLRTGDIGRIEAGRLMIDARARDLILRGAENVYPAEVEQRLEAHPDVAEAAVVGVPHPELGQEVKAIVVPRAGISPDTEALRSWCAEALAYYKVPTHWEVRNEPLPRNAAGKVMKKVLLGESKSPFVAADEGES